MIVETDYSLKKHNTFRLDIKTKYFINIQAVGEIYEFLEFPDYAKFPLLIIGEGSNILFTKDFEGIVVKPAIKGIEVVNETEKTIELVVGSGMNWDEFVLYCNKRNYGGIENLSNIPGTVGSSPVQNIGAYGVEAKNTIIYIEAFNIIDRKPERLSNNDCDFSYRNSIFKKRAKGKYIILRVAFKLSKNPQAVLHYGDLKHKVHAMGEANIQNVRKAVIEIRSQKLPDTEVIGNGGSFFKNPVISVNQCNCLKKDYPELPTYPVNKEKIKVAAGWLIEKCGWKGFRDGDAGVHSKQSLVLVNYGNASGKQILKLSEKIQKSVHEKFSIKLETEINII